jgi:hypothetical protein
VQIKDIARWVGELGKELVVPGAAANDALVPIIVYFFALSFLGVYLITRLYLTSAFQQTLGLLAGGGRSGQDFGNLKQTLAAAGKSGQPEDLEPAMAAYDGASLSGAERADPDLNANVVRILAKQIAGNTETKRPGDRRAELMNAVAKAAADPTIKAQLKNEMESGQMTTGDASLDTEIKGKL